MISIVLLISALVLFLFLYIRSKGRYEECILSLDDRSYPLKKFLPIGLLLMDRTGYSYNTRYDKKLTKSLGELHGSKNAEYHLRLHWASKVCYALLIVLLFSFFGSILWLQALLEGSKAEQVTLINGSELQRPDFGKGSKAVQLAASIQKGDAEQQQEYTIVIPEAAPPDDAAAVRVALKRLTEDLIRGKNARLDAVSSALNLKSSYEELGKLGIAIDWKSSNETAVAATGAVTLPDSMQESEKAVLTAVVTKGRITREKSFAVNVRRPQLTDEQIIAKAMEELQEKLKGISGNDDGKDKLKLPTASSMFDTVKISWRPAGASGSDSGISMLVFSLLLIMTVIYLLDNDLNVKVQKRRMCMKRDFPDFLNKLLLLINAGMTVNRAMEKIAADAKADSPLYEEVSIAIADIRGGKPEHQALEEFAGRCRTPEISKFVSVILQNLRKGNAELVSILRLQSAECWEMRKSLAKRMGEEASTKLLLPMMLMLIAILMIVATPAVLSMKAF